MQRMLAQFCAVTEGMIMNVGNVAHSPLLKQAAPIETRQNQTIQPPSKSTEEATESPQARAKEAGKGAAIDTFA